MQLSRQFTRMVIVCLSLHCLGDCTGLPCSRCDDMPVNLPPSVAHDGHQISIRLQMWKGIRWPARSFVQNKAHTSFAEHGLRKLRRLRQGLGKPTSKSPSPSIEPRQSSVFPSRKSLSARSFRSWHVSLSMQAHHHTSSIRAPDGTPNHLRPGSKIYR